MKKTLLLLGLCLSLGGSFAQDSEPLVAASRAAVKVYATRLKGELVKAMKSGGPLQAIEVCHGKAPMIAREVSLEKGLRIGRTSLKTRNPGNAPDAWERKVLVSFEERKARGESPSKMEYSELVERNGQREFRYMKAIPTGAVCMNCHGADIAPAVAAKLDALYPQDQARGFKMGDIRGAFTIRQSKE